MKRIFGIFAAASLLAGCSSDGDPSDSAVSYDIVRLEAQKAETGGVYTFQKPESSETVTYTTAQLIDTTRVHVGDRLLIAYVAESGTPYVSGAIRLRGYAPITNSALRKVDAAGIADWDKDPVWLASAWMMGNYLNVRARLPYDATPRRYCVAIDTINPGPASRPDVYLVHARGDDAPEATFDRMYYASFDMTELLDNEQVEGFTLHVANTNLPLDKLNFSKK